MTLPVMEPDLDAAVLKEWARMPAWAAGTPNDVPCL